MIKDKIMYIIQSIKNKFYKRHSNKIDPDRIVCLIEYNIKKINQWKSDRDDFLRGEALRKESETKALKARNDSTDFIKIHNW